MKKKPIPVKNTTDQELCLPNGKPIPPGGTVTVSDIGELEGSDVQRAWLRKGMLTYPGAVTEELPERKRRPITITSLLRDLRPPNWKTVFNPGYADMTRRVLARVAECRDQSPFDKLTGAQFSEMLDQAHEWMARADAVQSEAKQDGTALEAYKTYCDNALYLVSNTIIRLIREKASNAGATGGKKSGRRVWAERAAEQVSCWGELPEPSDPLEFEDLLVCVYRDGDTLCAADIDDLDAEPKTLARSTFEKRYLKS